MTANASDDEKVAVVRAILEAWSAQDWAKVESLFAPDGVLHSVMIEPVVGRAAFAERLRLVSDGLERVELHIKSIGVVDGRVYVERVDKVDRFGHHGELPVVGIMRVEDGLVTEWLEYYDRATMMRCRVDPAIADHPFTKLLDRIIAAAEAGEPADLLDIYDDGAVIWHNTDNREKSVYGNMKMISTWDEYVTDRKYTDRRIHIFDGGVVQQHVVRGTQRGTGEQIALHACVVVAVQDGKIVRLDEYIDSAEAARFRSEQHRVSGEPT